MVKIILFSEEPDDCEEVTNNAENSYKSLEKKMRYTQCHDENYNITDQGEALHNKAKYVNAGFPEH